MDRLPLKHWVEIEGLGGRVLNLLLLLLLWLRWMVSLLVGVAVGETITIGDMPVVMTMPGRSRPPRLLMSLLEQWRSTGRLGEMTRYPAIMRIGYSRVSGLSRRGGRGAWKRLHELDIAIQLRCVMWLLDDGDRRPSTGLVASPDHSGLLGRGWRPLDCSSCLLWYLDLHKWGANCCWLKWNGLHVQIQIGLRVWLVHLVLIDQHCIRWNLSKLRWRRCSGEPLLLLLLQQFLTLLSLFLIQYLHKLNHCVIPILPILYHTNS